MNVIIVVTCNVFNTLDENNTYVDVQGDRFTIVREIGDAGVVLLRNERGALPLRLGKGGVRSTYHCYRQVSCN